MYWYKMTNRERQERDASLIALVAAITLVTGTIIGFIAWSIGQYL